MNKSGLGQTGALHNLEKLMLPVHPGEILKEEYMAPLNLEAAELALNLRIPVAHIQEILSQKRSISADLAMRLAKFFGTDVNLWINLQTQYDINTLSEKTKKDLDYIIPYKFAHMEDA